MAKEPEEKDKQDKPKPASDKQDKAADETIVTGGHAVADGDQTVVTSGYAAQGDQTIVTGEHAARDDDQTIVTGGYEAHGDREDVLTRKAGPENETIVTGGASDSGYSGAPSTPEHSTKYRIIKPLGKGGFASVYLVQNNDLNRKEAIKILARELAEDADVTSRFVKEAQIAANFNHQNIVTVFEVEKSGDWNRFEVEEQIRKKHQGALVYFTMSFVEGRSLTSLIHRKGKIPQREAIKTIMDVCQALDYAHGKGVVHRDIKPDNVMVEANGNAVVMDFGIAKVADQTRQTAAGTFMGTARYVSPEQAMGKDIDGRSDIYSLGVTLYEAVTGRAPFESDQWMTVLYQHINEPPPAPELYVEDINRDLRTILMKMLAKKPEDRFQSARETYDALARVYFMLGGPDLSTEHMDNIATRRDYDRPGRPGTDATESAPTVRRSQQQEAQKEGTKAKGGVPPIAWIAVAVIVLAAVGWFATRGTPETPPDKPGSSSGQEQADAKPAVSGEPGTVMLTAFPKGEVVKVLNENGAEVETPLGALPRPIELPQGRYTIVVSYGDRIQEQTVPLFKEGPVNVHFEFELEDDLLLMGDL